MLGFVDTLIWFFTLTLDVLGGLLTLSKFKEQFQAVSYKYFNKFHLVHFNVNWHHQLLLPYVFFTSWHNFYCSANICMISNMSSMAGGVETVVWVFPSRCHRENTSHSLSTSNERKVFLSVYIHTHIIHKYLYMYLHLTAHTVAVSVQPPVSVHSFLFAVLSKQVLSLENIPNHSTDVIIFQSILKLALWSH